MMVHYIFAFAISAFATPFFFFFFFSPFSRPLYRYFRLPPPRLFADARICVIFAARHACLRLTPRHA